MSHHVVTVTFATTASRVMTPFGFFAAIDKRRLRAYSRAVKALVFSVGRHSSLYLIGLSGGHERQVAYFQHVEDPSYLLSVVEVIADSHEKSFTSAHDLLDAYTTFSNRIRSQSRTLQDCNKPLPALGSLMVHKDNFVLALRRDVGLAHVDPFSTLSHHRLSSEQTMSGSNIQASIKVDTKQYARDLSSLCQHALCALTTIFRFPAFHFLFTEHDLSILFGDVLDVSLADQLPVLNEARVCSLSLWTLACHRLPVSVLRSRQDVFVSALRRSLDTMRQPGSVVLDGLKAIMHVLEYYPTDLHLVLSPLLPHITMVLFQESLELRLKASLVLGTLANVLIDRKNHSLAEWQTFSDDILAYLESPSDHAWVDSGGTSLFQIVRAATSMESQTRRGDGPSWILAVLASLIIICGPTLFSKPAALHFILQSLALALKHERAIVRALYAHVWRCLVWTFSHMLSSDDDPASIRSALYVIKQELGGGIGIALATILLTPNQVSATQSHKFTDMMSQALSVIEAMVRMGSKHTCREGLMLLRALTSGAAVEQPSLRIYETPAMALFDGTVIGAEWDDLPFAIKSIPEVQPSVRRLEEMEIAELHKQLLQIWKYAASRRTREQDSDLVEIWQSVLVAQAHQLQNGRHAARAAEMLKYTSAIIVECLPSLPSADHQPDWGSWNVQDQLHILSFIDKLWSVMRDAFSAFNLWDPASNILASILKYAFHVLDPGVQTTWGVLCADLMITAFPSFLRDIHNLTESQMVVSTQRELWAVVAKSLWSSEPKLEWKELVKFLAIPVCAWVLTDLELEAWEGMLRSAITLPGDAVLLVQRFISQYLQGTEVENWESTVPLLRLLLSYVNEQGHSPPDELLHIINASLTTSYTRASHSLETLRHSLQLLSVVRLALIPSGPTKAMHIVQTLQGCLCVWIEDRAEVMSIDDFNSVAVSLYCDTIKVFEALPLSVQSLQDLASFLASAFSRIPTPAVAPFAFEKYWRATYHGRTEFYGSLPPKILSCLACFVDAFGGDLTDGLSLPIESQQSIIDGFQSQSKPHQDLSKISFRESSLSSMRNENSSGALGAEVAPQTRQRSFAGPEDTAFILASSDDEATRPTVLRQLDEYRSEMDISLLAELEQSMNKLAQESCSSIPLPLRPSPSSPSIELPSRALKKTSAKRKHSDRDNIPRKRSRTSRSTLRSVRKLESEPATRDVTPVNANVTRTSSVPLTRRWVFDGVQMPTFREVLRREKERKVETREHTPSLLAGLTSVPRTPSSRGAYRARTSPETLPSSVGSDEILDWENFHIDATSSEIDIERSLADAYSSSPPRSPTSIPEEPEDEPQILPPLNLRQARSRSEGSPSVPTRQTLQRANTGSERLDALLDVYTSVAQGASQIPMSELLQATRLVHQIGAVLTEQMGKKMGDPG